MSRIADVVDRTGLPQEVIERLKSLGFKYITLDLEGFRSGSMNAVLPVETLLKPTVS